MPFVEVSTGCGGGSRGSSPACRGSMRNVPHGMKTILEVGGASTTGSEGFCTAIVRTHHATENLFVSCCKIMRLEMSGINHSIRAAV